MPHTSHRKKKGPPNKRKEILDEDGWTRITKANGSTKSTLNTTPHVQYNDERAADEQAFAAVNPMTPEAGTTLDSMRAHFSQIEARWRGTELCKALKRVVQEKIQSLDIPISNCVLLGTGSFCGDAINWVGRHDVAYYQLAAFRTAVSTIQEVQPKQQQPVLSAYAQEPYYNDLDAGFLASLDITRVDHPKAFDLLDEASFAYSPFAEREVEFRILARKPQVWLHRPLGHLLGVKDDEDPNYKNAHKYNRTHKWMMLPNLLDIKGYPFHGSAIWWPKEDKDEQQDDTSDEG